MKPTQRFDIVTDTYAPDINGVAMTLGRLVAGLRSGGHIVHVFCSRSKDELIEVGSETSVRSMRMPGYSEVKIGMPSPLKLRKRWAKKRPDAVYVATESPLGLSALRAAKSLGIPCISGFHTNFHEYMERYRLGKLGTATMSWLRKVHNLADMTLTPSREVQTMLCGHGFENVNLLGRGTDTQLFHPDKRSEDLRLKWGAVDGAPVAISVGRVAAEKNLDVTIEAFQRMRERDPRTQCVIVGAGPLLDGLEASHPWIHFAGMQKGDDLAAHYASADIMIFPSETETFGNVVLEGMASGLICIAYNYAAGALLIHDGDNGLTAQKGDVSAFYSRALIALDLDAHARMRQRAREMAESHGWQAVLDRFEGYLLEVAKLAPVRRNKRTRLKYRSVFISDLHLGIKDSKANEVIDFLKHLECEHLILNGDIIDGWALRRGGKWTKRHSRVVRTIFKMADSKGTEVTYIRGNHDEVMESFLPLVLGNIRLLKETRHTGLNGREYLVVHGDGFDQIVTKHRWLAALGAVAYDTLLKVNRIYNRWRSWRGKPYYSLSKKIKSQVKGAVSFVGRYEEQLQKFAERKGCDGIICGHIHTPGDKMVGDIHYLNSGDWVETMSAVVEHCDGRMEVLHYDEFLEELARVERERADDWDEDAQMEKFTVVAGEPPLDAPDIATLPRNDASAVAR